MDVGALGGVLWASGLREGRTAGGHGQGLPRSLGCRCRGEHMYIYGFLPMLGAQGDGEGTRVWGAAPVSSTPVWKGPLPLRIRSLLPGEGQLVPLPTSLRPGGPRGESWGPSVPCLPHPGMLPSAHRPPTTTSPGPRGLNQPTSLVKLPSGSARVPGLPTGCST